MKTPNFIQHVLLDTVKNLKGLKVCTFDNKTPSQPSQDSIDTILVDLVAGATLVSERRSSKAVIVPKLISMATTISSEKADQTHSLKDE